MYDVKAPSKIVMPTTLDAGSFLYIWVWCVFQTDNTTVGNILTKRSPFYHINLRHMMESTSVYKLQLNVRTTACGSQGHSSTHHFSSCCFFWHFLSPQNTCECSKTQGSIVLLLQRVQFDFTYLAFFTPRPIPLLSNEKQNNSLPL